MKRLIPALAAASFVLVTGFANAQMPQHERGMGPGPNREAMRTAYEACKDKPDHRACMAQQMCAKAQDPARCQEHAKERGAQMQQRLEARQKMHEACNGKRGDELSSCIREQRHAQMNQRMEERQKAHEACNGKRGDELGKCLREQRDKLGPRHPAARG